MKFLLSCLISAAAFTSYAQELVVTGSITDKDSNEPVAGATIKVLETNETTLSDFTGAFKVTVKDGYENLLITAAGYEEVKVFISGQSSVSVNMSKAASGTSESSASQLSSSDLGTQPVTDLEQTTQGRVAGVFVQNSGGKLGQGTKVRIRGGSSLTGSNDPLYVVDGVPLSSGNQSDIDPSSIESLEVIKDASGMALYGSRAANGVVIITTKRGQAGKLKAEVEYQVGVSQTPKTLDMMSKDDYNVMNLEYTLRSILAGIPNADINLGASDLENYFSYENLALWYSEMDALRASSTDGTISYTLTNGDQITMSTQNPIFRFAYDTDWQDEAFRTALSNRTNVNLSGGSEMHNAFLNINYLAQEGILVGNDYERFGGRFNVNSNWTDKFSTSVSFGYAKTNDNRVNEDGDDGNPVQMALLPPGDASDPANNYRLFVRSNEYNPETEVYGSKNFETNDRINGTASMAYSLSDKLSLNVDAGLDYLNLEDIRRQGPATQAGTPAGFSQLLTSEVVNYLFNGSVNYSLPIDRNQLDVLAGASYQRSATDISYRSARVNSITQLRNLTDSEPSLVDNPVPGSASAFLSYFASVNYTIDGKYAIEANVRADGSSRFSEENRFGVFPAVSASWDIARESFLEGVPVINTLKLSAAYGILGNTPFADFLYRTNYFNVIYGSDSIGLRVANLANSQLKWETTHQADLSLEFVVLNDRISGSVSYYNRTTTDLLFPVPVSQVSGFSSAIKNTGEMVNSGLEFYLSTVNVSTPALTWETSINVSSNKNEVTDIGGQPLISGPSAFIEGESAGVFYLPEYVGVDPLNGQALYDFNGLTTTDYNMAVETSRKVVGNPNPKFYGGFTNNLTYKMISLDFMIQFVQGVDAYWETGEIIGNSGFGLYNQVKDQNDRWYKFNDAAKYPVLDPSLGSPNPSSRWIVDASYVRLKSLSLSLNLTEYLGERLKLSQFSVYIGGQNLYTITKYPGYDPDVSYSDPSGGDFAANINRGIDFFSAPQPRVFTSGIKIGF